jgi:N-formylmaleamate deformylase
LPDYAADLAGLLAQLTLQQPIVILGHSMGARIAASLAVSHPKSSRAMILADPPVSGPGGVTYPYPLEFYLEQLRKAKEGTSVEELRRFLPTWTDEQLNDRVEWLPTCDETAIIESHRGLNEEDFFYFWDKINIPLLLLYGQESVVLSEAAAAKLREMNPRAETVRIAKAGHMIPWDNLPDFLGAVRRFIRSVTDPSQGPASG